MPIRVQSADNAIHEFPDGTDQGAIDKAMKSYAQEHQKPLGLGEMAIGAVTNLPESAQRFGESVIAPIVHPVETAKGLYHLGRGVAEKLGRTSLDSRTGNITFDRGAPGQYEPYADAAGEFLAKRYGGWENIKHTISDDPIGFVADISSIFTGGEMLGLRGAATAARLTDPVNLATKAAKAAAKAPTSILGGYTGMGAEGLRQARLAAKEGGAVQEAHLENLRNPELAPLIVSKARDAFDQIKAERSAQYLQDKAKFSQSQKPLNFDEIDKAINKAHEVEQFEGRNISDIGGVKKYASDVVKEDIENVVANWKVEAKADPRLATIAGFDALKRAIGKIKDAQPFNTPERRVAEQVYGAVRGTIVKMDPEYAEAMSRYEKGSDLLSQLEKTLSMGKKATDDTALRKLLTATRSNVNTNFGERLRLVEELNKRDPTILPSLAGQAGSSWVPRGLAGLIPAGIGAGATATHGIAAVLRDPKVISTIMASSPRLWSEIYSKIGSAQRKAGELTPQAIIDATQRVNPDVLRRILLGSRTMGAPGGQNAPQ
jgi:hypothetical protein